MNDGEKKRVLIKRKTNEGEEDDDAESEGKDETFSMFRCDE